MPGVKHAVSGVWRGGSIRGGGGRRGFQVKYFLSNATAGLPLEVLLRVAFSRWHIERGFQDEKGELGMDHFECGHADQRVTGNARQRSRRYGVS